MRRGAVLYAWPVHDGHRAGLRPHHLGHRRIGRYAPDAACARGLADLQVLANLIPASGYVHGSKPTSIEASDCAFSAVRDPEARGATMRPIRRPNAIE
jgi:hypothetical protein